MSGAKKDDRKDNKPMLRYVSLRLLEETSYAMMAGSKKYGEFNYLKGHKASQLIEAAIRHLFAALEGEQLDKDCTERLGSPVRHLGCALANINMYLQQEQAGTLKNDLLLTPKDRAQKLLEDAVDEAMSKYNEETQNENTTETTSNSLLDSASGGLVGSANLLRRLKR